MAGGDVAEGATLPRRPARRRRRWVWLLATSGVVVAAVLLVVGFEVPIATAFALSVRSEGFAPSVEYREFPMGAHVTFVWNTTNGRNVTFSLLGSGGQVLSSTTGSGGRVAFLAANGPYGFQSFSLLPEVVNVDGNYASPALP